MPESNLKRKSKKSKSGSVAGDVIQNLMHLQNDILLVIDKKSQSIVFHNFIFEKVTGYDASEIEGAIFPGKFITGSDQIKVRTCLNNIHRTGSEILDLKIISSNNTMFSYEFAITQPENGLSDYIIANGRNITEFSKRYDALRMSESLLKRAESLGNFGHWRLDLETDLLTFSDGMYNMMKVDKESFIHEQGYFANMIHPEDQQLLDKFREVARNETDEPFDISYRFICPDGEIRHFKVKSRMVRNNEGKPEAFFGTTIDITEKEKSRKELQKQNDEYQALSKEYKAQNENLYLSKEIAEKNEKYFRQLIEKSPLAIVVIDKNNNIEYVNPKFTDQFGYEIENIRNIENWWQLAYPDPHYRTIVYESWTRAVDKAFRENKEIETQEWEVTAKDHSKHICRFYMVPLGDKSFVVINDITDERKKHAELVNAKERAEINEKNLLTIIENSPLPMVIAEGGQYITFVNKKFTELFGYTQNDIPTGDHWFTKAYPDKEYRTIVESTWRNTVTQAQSARHDVEPQEYIMTTKTGENRYVEFRAVILDNKVVIVANDMTEIRLKERELIEAKEKAEESDRLKSAFLANMSHEIRTPMNGILGFADLLKNSDFDEHNKERYISLIEKSGQRMLNTINDLIDIAKIESGQAVVNFAITNLIELYGHLNDFFRPEVSQKGLELRINIPPVTPCLISTDKDKLYAILSNLIKNAIKFTRSGRIETGFQTGNTMVEFYVSDQGSGIPHEMLDKVFERFVQADSRLTNPYEGAGLGLPISKAFVELLGGSISVKSKPGKGTVFTFTIPYIKPSESINITQHAMLLKNTIINAIINNLSILVVDDEEVSRTYLVELFTGKCRRLNNAVNGKSAVEFIRNDEDVDLVLMDIKMPEMDGYTATQKIREFNRKVIIVAQTAYAFTGDRDKAIQAGCNDYLSKPIRREDLYNIIIEYFSKTTNPLT